MKLSKLLLVGFASMALAACDMPWSKKDKGDDTPEYDLNPEITGGSEEEKKAILETLNNKPICMRNGVTSAEIFYDSRPNLMEDEGDTVKLTTKQVVSGKTVDISWGLDETQEYFSKWLKPSTDQNHWFIELDYKGYDYGKAHGDGTLSWKITKMECGEAKTTGDVVTYNANVKNEQYFHEDKSIAWCYEFSNTVFEKTVGETKYRFPSRFNVVDYEKVDEKTGKLQPYYKTNNPDAKEKQYYYVNVTGKCIYLAPDGNFGLIADGDHVMEIYAGSGTALKESNYPNLKVGAVVKVVGNLGQYCGNVQLGFITKVLEGDATQISEPSEEFKALTEAKIASLTKETFSAQSQAVKVDDIDMDGSLRQVTGTLVADSIKWCDGKADAKTAWKDATADSIRKDKRFSFKLQVGEQQFTVSYDYHVTRNDSSSQLFENLQTALKSGKSITVKGFARYFGSNSEPFNPEALNSMGNPGHWTLVPFNSAHVSTAA